MNGKYSFSEALTLLKRGIKVQRKGWNGKGMYLTVVKCTEYQVDNHNLPLNHSAPDGNVQNLLPWIGMKTADNFFTPWVPSQADLLSEDWGEFIPNQQNNENV